ncbi:MAG: GHKL domain-containing protein, partial [Thermodesulfovibrionia bacterium]|nr:GHKL domain-containing protein [Thermodesulfovibrionia bacterium]
SFSRESKGEYSELNVNKVIDDTLGFSASKIKQKGIQITKEYEDALPKVDGEKTELQQVILNMITNALDAMTDGGKLTIRTDITKDKNNVIMEFIDNGTGIEKEHLGKIFDPFYTTKRPGKGTGLGLSVSYKIIKKHGGNISVESEPGKGTKFTIYLPAVKSNNT